MNWKHLLWIIPISGAILFSIGWFIGFNSQFQIIREGIFYGSLGCYSMGRNIYYNVES